MKNSFLYYRSLVALLVPGLAFIGFSTCVLSTYNLTWAKSLTLWPFELWIISIAGTIATFAGVFDWNFHRKKNLPISIKEKNAEFKALAYGGIPLFVLMATATILKENKFLLLPIVLAVLFTVVMICYDEFIFHRRCCRYESMLHRLLVFGNGSAWLAWLNFCFVSGGIHNYAV